MNGKYVRNGKALYKTDWLKLGLCLEEQRNVILSRKLRKVFVSYFLEFTSTIVC
jgi:hypothetical protein